MKERIKFFSEEILQKIPIHYRFMVQEDTETLYEITSSQRYSTCNVHRSSEYPTKGTYKPISNIDLDNLT